MGSFALSMLVYLSNKICNYKYNFSIRKYIYNKPSSLKYKAHFGR